MVEGKFMAVKKIRVDALLIAEKVSGRNATASYFENKKEAIFGDSMYGSVLKTSLQTCFEDTD